MFDLKIQLGAAPWRPDPHSELVETFSYYDRPLVGVLRRGDSNTLFEWEPIKDTFTYNGNSHILSIISKRTGTPMQKLEAEITVRASILKKMIEKKIMSYAEFTKVINLYYKEPQTVIRELGIK